MNPSVLGSELGSAQVGARVYEVGVRSFISLPKATARTRPRPPLAAPPAAPAEFSAPVPPLMATRLALQVGGGLGGAAVLASLAWHQHKIVSAATLPSGPPVYLATRRALVGPRATATWSSTSRFVVEEVEPLSPERRHAGTDTLVRMRRR